MELKFKGDKPWGGPVTAKNSQEQQRTKRRKKCGRRDEIGNSSLVDLCGRKMMIDEEEDEEKTGEYK